jgi:hypothetical protein
MTGMDLVVDPAWTQKAYGTYPARATFDIGRRTR